MQFVILGYDGKDDGALERRLTVREAHLKLARENYDNGKLIAAAGLLDESGQMIGSNMIVEFKSRKELDIYLKTEPYITGNVWKEVKIFLAKVAQFGNP